MRSIDRSRYQQIYGPTTGGTLRLADTNLTVRISHDFLSVAYGDESVYGGGKAVRDGMAQDPSATSRGSAGSAGGVGWVDGAGSASGATSSSRALDTVITGVIVLDAIAGVVKGDVGIRDGRIVKIGKAGNPNTQDGVDPELIIGPGTEVIAGEHRILTAGGVDSHIHYITPQQAEHGLAGGITTFFGGGTGPAEGTLGTTCTPGPSGVQFMARAAEGMPVNTGFLGKGSGALPEALAEQIIGGAAGLKIHEDWGATPANIRTAMDVCDTYDVQLAIHTDTLNEGGFFESTARAFGGRTVHTFHSEGVGGGHAPDILRVAGMPNVLPASTNPTLPYTVNSVEELLDMVMVCHHLSHDIPEDIAFADSRVRAETIAAETVLHDLGLISIFSSDSQAMGRVGESWQRAFQTAHHCRDQRGELAEDRGHGDDNERVLRYIAKLTINPAIAQGIADHVGSIEPGKLADLVLWPIETFGAKPRLVLRQGRIAYAQMGDPNASLATPQPVFYRDQFANYGTALTATRVTFMSQAAIDAGVPEELGLASTVLPVHRTRSIGKRDMVRNERIADIRVDPDTYEVTVDGVHATIAPAQSLPLAQKFFLF